MPLEKIYTPAGFIQETFGKGAVIFFAIMSEFLGREAANCVQSNPPRNKYTEAKHTTEMSVYISTGK